MSKWMGCRVSYPCDNCGKQFTINKRCVDRSESDNLMFCSKECESIYKIRLHTIILREYIKGEEERTQHLREIAECADVLKDKEKE